jgi:cytochrome b6-f complex iron-sulfur subunit
MDTHCEGMPRRDFLANTAKAVVAVGLLDVNAWSSPAGPYLAISTVTIDLTNSANSDLLTPDTGSAGSMYVTISESSFQMIVVRNSATVVSAFLSKCTHQGCTIPLPVNKVCICGCHGSEFDDMGNLLQGPATTNLTQFTATLNAAQTTITVQSLNTGTLGREAAPVNQVLHVTYAQDARTLEMVFPDPSASYRIRLLGLSGRMVEDRKVSGVSRYHMRLPQLDKGTYLLEVISSAHTFNYKFTSF